MAPHLPAKDIKFIITSKNTEFSVQMPCDDPDHPTGPAEGELYESIPKFG